MANTEKHKVAKQRSNSELLPLGFDKESLMASNIFESKICAVIISYNPNDTIYNNVEQLLLDVKKIFIIDNGSCENNKKILYKILENFNNVKILLNQDNLGIAYALNQGINLSIKSGFEWVITLDQDSKFEMHSLEKMFHLAYYLSKNHKVGIIAPTYQLQNGELEQSFYESKLLNNVPIETEYGTYKLIFTTMTSGNLIPTKVFQEVGYFDEHFFIDYVDFEFCLRLNKLGYDIFQSIDTVLEHELGSSLEKKIFFNLMKLKVSVHSPLRIYYKYRNRFITYKRYIFDFPVWVAFDFLHIPKEILKISLVCSQRLLYGKRILRGIFDGLCSGK
jgi:rhamnosyltransferase